MSFNRAPMASINNMNLHSSVISIGHMNACSMNPSKSKFLEIHRVIYESTLDVIGISETWLSESISSEAVGVDGYSFVRCDRENRRGGGVGLYISNNYSLKVIFKKFL